MMKHPTEEDLRELLEAIDTAMWCLAIKKNTKKGKKCPVDWKSSLDDLQKSWEVYQIKMSDKEGCLGHEIKEGLG